MLGNDAMEFLKTLHKLDNIWNEVEDAEYNDRQLTQFAERYHEHKLKLLGIADVMPSGFTLKQENAIWAIIQHLAKEQFKNPRRVYKRKDVFDLIKAEMDW